MKGLVVPDVGENFKSVFGSGSARSGSLFFFAFSSPIYKVFFLFVVGCRIPPWSPFPRGSVLDIKWEKVVTTKASEAWEIGLPGAMQVMG